MLPKSLRLVKEKEIKQAYATKYRLKTSYFQFFLRKNYGRDFQLLVIVSKKIFKKANKRNRLKRKIYAIFEELSANQRLPRHISLIIQVVSKNAIVMTKDELSKEILPHLTHLYQKIFFTENSKSGILNSTANRIDSKKDIDNS